MKPAQRPRFLLVASLLVGLLAAGAPAEPTKAKAPAIYDESGNGHELLANGFLQAKKENKKVLVQYGGNWSGWCVLLHKAFNENPELKAALDKDFVVVYIDTNSNKSLVKA
jgi:thioredoxin-related protein